MTLPIYQAGKEAEFDRSPLTVASILYSPDLSRVCKQKPLKCQENAAFVVNTNYLGDKEDVVSDDLGTFRNNGLKKWFFCDDNCGQLEEIDEPRNWEEGMFTLEKTYWVHQTYNDFRRRLWRLKDHQGTETKYIFLEYSFKDDEHPIQVSTHGNSKGKKPHIRQEKSTMTRLKTLAKEGKKPSEMYDIVFEEKGGMLGATSVASLPRHEQGKYLKRCQKRETEKDELWSIANMAKEEMKKKEPFVRYPEASTGNFMLADDRQLKDVERFCTDRNHHGIFGIDTVFKCGNFFATPTTYPHLMLVDKTTSRHPTMLGPLAVHKRLDTDAYEYLGCSMTRANPALKNIVAIGSDGDEKIHKGMFISVVSATWMLDKRHVEDNIKRKLSKMGITGDKQNPFIADIFGDDIEKEKGLVDSTSAEEFEQSLQRLKPTWDQRELLLTASGEAEFFGWFVRYQATLIKERMIYPVRKAVGLGHEFYYNNAPESINNTIKRKNDYKACNDVVQFTENVREIKDIQARNVERAIVGEGPYRLCPEYSDLCVEPEVWFYNMTASERQSHLEKFANMNIRQKKGKDFGVTPSCTNRNLTQGLSVSFEDSGLSQIVHQSSWQKAIQLVSKADSMSPAPGRHRNKAVFVESQSAGVERPNLVLLKTDGSATCECQKFKETKLCSHIIAVAERDGSLATVLAWYNSSGFINLAQTAARGAPKKSGKKPGEKQRVRHKGTPLTRNCDEYSARPGIAVREPEVWENEKDFFLMFRTCNQKKCISCKAEFDKVPPNNLCISHKEKYFYPYQGNFQDMRLSRAEKNFYYHVSLACIKNRHPKFLNDSLKIPDDVKANLKDCHQLFLKNSLGINC